MTGVPETDSVRPFVCAEYKGKRGTFAIMCNGDVRFIPETIPDETFKALCTIAGGEKIDNLDAVAPKVPSPQAVLKTKPAVAAKPPPPKEVTANPAGHERYGLCGRERAELAGLPASR